VTKPDPETLERLRVRIAELCGWKQLPNKLWKKGKRLCGGTQNYCYDLNAVHEVEQALPQNKLGAYSDELRILLMPESKEESLLLRYKLWHAAAWQRCVALDRTLSKDPIV
jgi:hypothetical protein